MERKIKMLSKQQNFQNFRGIVTENQEKLMYQKIHLLIHEYSENGVSAPTGRLLKYSLRSYDRRFILWIK